MSAAAAEQQEEADKPWRSRHLRRGVRQSGLVVTSIPRGAGRCSLLRSSVMAKSSMRDARGKACANRGSQGTPKEFWMLIRKHRDSAHTLDRAFEREDLAIRDAELHIFYPTHTRTGLIGHRRQDRHAMVTGNFFARFLGK